MANAFYFPFRLGISVTLEQSARRLGEDDAFSHIVRLISLGRLHGYN